MATTARWNNVLSRITVASFRFLPSGIRQNPTFPEGVLHSKKQHQKNDSDTQKTGSGEYHGQQTKEPARANQAKEQGKWNRRNIA